MLLAGSLEQLRNYDENMAIYGANDKPVIIVGAGRVGRGTAEAFEERGMDYRIIEKNPERVGNSEKYVLGSGEDLSILKKAGINDAPCIIITTRDDDMNIYLCPPAAFGYSDHKQSNSAKKCINATPGRGRFCVICYNGSEHGVQYFGAKRRGNDRRRT